MRQIIAAIVLGLAITSVGAADVEESTVLSTLDKTHPRLMLKDTDLKLLKARCKSDPILQKCVADLIKSAESSMKKPPLVHKKIGPRLLHVSRDCLRRTYCLALAWRWTGEKKYADKAVENLLTVCAFKDWNPSHFLDTAEMSHAVGVGYDWLYSYIDEATRKKIRDGLIKNGLAIGVAGYNKKHWWSRSSHNWNQVCNGGLVAGALAIADTDPQYARAIIPQAVKLLPLAIRTYGPDGAWSEGPGYWHYATRYTAYGLAAMETALGTDFGLSEITGLSEAGEFPIYTTGPTGMYVNFADSGTRAARGPMGCMFYLARKFKRPSISDAEHDMIARRSATPEHVMWYVPSSGKKTVRDLDRLFRGSVPLAVFRSSWDDSDALFVGIKAGYNQVNHGHLDLGNFEMDAMGVRWSRDLGSDDYNLPGYWDSRRDTGKRWRYYRLNSQSHSIPLINGANQSANGVAGILKFEASRPQPLVVIDLTSAYKKAASKTARGLKLVCDRKAVLVQDEFELTGEKGAEITWAMTTDAKIAIKSKTLAELTLDGKKLTARILSPSGAEFAVESAEQKSPQKSNKGVSRLLAQVKGAKGAVRIAVLLAPAWKGFTPPAAMQLTPLGKW
ncbi:MAG: heparinase II/III family protein [Phycisphaerae bacterium]|nr:heparinase II/III family protein [Phycisphaerae bacterium]